MSPHHMHIKHKSDLRCYPGGATLNWHHSWIQIYTYLGCYQMMNFAHYLGRYQENFKKKLNQFKPERKILFESKESFIEDLQIS